MCEAVGHPVLALQRVAFGPVTLDGLRPGSHRLLAPAEIKRLRGAAGSLQTGGREPRLARRESPL
jgi:23S rRNA pseudouridine2605 synthase